MKTKSIEGFHEVEVIPAIWESKNTNEMKWL